MQVAPLQPKGIVFEEVSIQVMLDEDNSPISTENFDFQSVRVNCEVGFADMEHQGDKSTDDSMLVSVRLNIPNDEGKKAPYKVNVAVTGIFKWLNKTTPRVERRDLTVVNGATILYGAIREMVLTVTSRSIPGSMLLPSFNFLDNKPSIVEKEDTDNVGKPSLKKRSRAALEGDSVRGK